ncbi:hypothetical protein Pd630_LPD09032 (plasmid) [Rhodococcus opacus PD630]|nr:hypothetical protein Pd630_LPD09032 [Rhodococcus opacus PD630]
MLAARWCYPRPAQRNTPLRRSDAITPQRQTPPSPLLKPGNRRSSSMF